MNEFQNLSSCPGPRHNSYRSVSRTGLQPAEAMSATAADGGRKRKRERRRSASPAPVAAPAGGSKEGAPAAPVTVRELRDALEAVRGGRPGAAAGAGAAAAAGAGAAAAAAAAISLVERAAPSVRGPGTTRLLAELVPALAGPGLASPSSSPAAWAAARARELLRRPGGEEGGSAASVPELDALLASAGPLDGLAHEREVQDRLLGCLGELEGRMRARGGGVTPGQTSCWSLSAGGGGPRCLSVGGARTLVRTSMRTLCVRTLCVRTLCVRTRALTRNRNRNQNRTPLPASLGMGRGAGGRSPGPGIQRTGGGGYSPGPGIQRSGGGGCSPSTVGRAFQMTPGAPSRRFPT